MHTIKLGQTTFHYNPDLSGHVTIIDVDGTSLNIPGYDLVAFVGHQEQLRDIKEIENEDPIRYLRNKLKAKRALSPEVN